MQVVRPYYYIHYETYRSIGMSNSLNRLYLPVIIPKEKNRTVDNRLVDQMMCAIQSYLGQKNCSESDGRLKGECLEGEGRLTVERRGTVQRMSEE